MLDSSGAEETARLRAALMRITRSLDRLTQRPGMTSSEVSVLSAVVRAERIPLADLSQSEGLNPTMLSRIVGTLTRIGYVSRVRASDDRRMALVEATPAGRERHEQLRAERSRVLADYLGDLTDDERAAIVAALPALEKLAKDFGRRDPQ